MKNPVLPSSAWGEQYGFTADRFVGYLWDNDDGSIIISAVMSLHPGKGHFSKLVKDLIAKGKKVKVPTPLPKMESILKEWGFRKTFERDERLECDIEIWVSPEIIRGDAKRYYMSVALSDILKQSSAGDEGRKATKEALDFYMAQYENAAGSVGVESAAHSFHVELDKKIATKRADMPELAKQIKCGEGCAFCCYNQVDISGDEALLIKAVCEEDGIEIDITRLRLQAEKKDIKAWNKLTPSKKRCVFLDKSNLCSIYEYRPAACRKLYVITDPEFCNLKKIQKVGKFVDWHVEVLASAILNGSRNGPLAEVLLEVL